MQHKMPRIRLLRHPTMRKMPQTQFRKQREMHRTQRIQPRKPHRTLKMRRMRRKTLQYSVPFTDLVRPVRWPETESQQRQADTTLLVRCSKRKSVFWQKKGFVWKRHVFHVGSDWRFSVEAIDRWRLAHR